MKSYLAISIALTKIAKLTGQFSGFNVLTWTQISNKAFRLINHQAASAGRSHDLYCQYNFVTAGGAPGGGAGKEHWRADKVQTTWSGD